MIIMSFSGHSPKQSPLLYWGLLRRRFAPPPNDGNNAKGFSPIDHYPHSTRDFPLLYG